MRGPVVDEAMPWVPTLSMTIASSIREGDNSARGRQLTAEQQKYQLVIPNGCAARGAPGRNQNPWARHAPFMSASPTNRKDLAPVQTSRHLVAPGARPGPCQRFPVDMSPAIAKEAPCTAPRRQMEMGGGGRGGRTTYRPATGDQFSSVPAGHNRRWQTACEWRSVYDH